MAQTKHRKKDCGSPEFVLYIISYIFAAICDFDGTVGWIFFILKSMEIIAWAWIIVVIPWIVCGATLIICLACMIAAIVIENKY